MQFRQRVNLAAGVANTVALILAASQALAAGHGTTLSVQGRGETAAPQVRSVQRGTSDNERLVAAANETVELLLADGTSITLSPGTSIVIERYRYDRGSHAGELRLLVEHGAIRTVGGVLNNSSAIVVRAQGGEAVLDNAVAYIQVDDGHVDVALVAGRGVTINGGGESRSLTKAGTALSLQNDGAFVGTIRTLSRADLQRYTYLVNPGLASGVVPTFVVDARTTHGAAVVSPDTAGATEDSTAKDVKLAPVPATPVAPAAPCSNGGCVAGVPNFDLGGSIGSIANRQTGRTTGAVWQRQYQQGEAIATQGMIRGYAPDYSAAGDGRRDTTARLFSSNPATPYSLTLSASNPATSASSYAALTCLAATSGGCKSSPIVNLYDGSGGVVYRAAGLAGAIPAELSKEILLGFPGGMSTGTFGAYPILVALPFDLDRPGALISASVNASIDGCVQGTSSNCTTAYGSVQERQDDVSRSDFLNPYSPTMSSQPFTSAALSLFSQYAPKVTYSQEFIPTGPNTGFTNYYATVSFDGISAYDISSLQAGFHRMPIRNFESSLRDICVVGTSACETFAGMLFGEGFGVPLINRDLSDPFFDPRFPTYEEQFADVLVRDPDSFLAADVTSRLPGDNQRLFYATGSVSGRLPVGAAARPATLDAFRLSPGLDASVALGRAFLRPDTLLNIAPSALLSSDLLVLNAPYTTTISSPSRALHYDFAVVGTGVNQTSTISVTLGTLTYDPASTSAQLSGRTVGSTARSGSTRYSGSVEGAVFSTAVGGGNPNIADTGRAGYLVLENYDPVSAPMGGLERTIENGTAAQTNYATLRVGQIAAGGSQTAPANRTDLNLTGYAAGFAEITSATAGAVQLVPLVASQGMQLVSNAASGSAGATLAATLGGDSVTLDFGSRATGGSGLSAYTGAKEFAAMTGAAPNLASGAITDATAANAAIVSGAPLIGSSSTQGWTAALDDTTRARMTTNAANSTGYRYLQWGFFFGDFTTKGGSQAHTHLTSWVAGRATPEGTPLPTGSVDYAGHVFANISNGDQLYSAAGGFANHWDFATRAGTGTMSLDGQNYAFVTRLLGLRREGAAITSTSTARFEGLISSAADASAYIGSLNGTFAADPAATTDPLQLRAAVMGDFSLARTLGGKDYRAVGTFAGERTGK